MPKNKQIQQKIINHTKQLSNSSKKKVLDFIEFLQYKQEMSDLEQELTELSNSSEKHLEEEFDDYEEKFPNE